MYSNVICQNPHVQESTTEELIPCCVDPLTPLPKYSSTDDEDLLRFISEFEDTTSKFKYTNYDLLLLLKQQITGRALTLITCLEADKQGFKHAKELLIKAFASSDTQKYNVIRQIADIKLTDDTDPI